MTRLQLGDLFYTQGGVLERRFVGSILYMAQQILGGGYSDPTAEQTAFANAIIASDFDGITAEAKKALQWGLIVNATLQQNGVETIDGDLDYIVAEYAKLYA